MGGGGVEGILVDGQGWDIEGKVGVAGAGVGVMGGKHARCMTALELQHVAELDFNNKNCA